MGREVPFDKTATCDGCGVIGAFDFCGDFYCDGCFVERIEGHKVMMEINTYPVIELMVQKKENKKRKKL
jgi:hypothetical protein